MLLTLKYLLIGFLEIKQIMLSLFFCCRSLKPAKKLVLEKKVENLHF